MNCENRFNHAYQTEDYHSGNNVTTQSYDHDHNWYIDTGATDHLISDLNRLFIASHYEGKVRVEVANGTSLHISHIDHSKIHGLRRPLHFKNILYVPQIMKHILSIDKLVSNNNVFIEIYPNDFIVKDKITKKTLLVGKSKGGLFLVLIRHSSRFANLSTKVSSSQWHQRFDHPIYIVVKSILKSNKLDCSFNLWRLFVMHVNVQRIINYCILILFMPLHHHLSESTLILRVGSSVE